MKLGMRARTVAARLAAYCFTAGACAMLPASAQGHADAAGAAQARAARAITLAPHITELVFAAGAGDRIVGTVSSSDFPSKAKSIPRIGDGINVNVEKTLALRPDVVIAWLPSGAAQTLAPSLSRLGLTLLYSRPQALDDIPGQVRRFGQLFSTEAAALPAAKALEERIASLRAGHAGARTVSVFIEVGASPLYTIGADPLLNDALQSCGGVNIYADTAIAAPQISAESVLVKQPQVVIAPASGSTRVDEVRERWAALGLPAALKGHVYGIDPDAFFRPGPRLVDATQELCSYLDMAR